MRTGKVKENILKRSVLARQGRTKTGAGAKTADRSGNGNQTKTAADTMARARNCPDPEKIAVLINPVEGWTLAAPRAVYGAVNALAARGTVPEVLALTVLMPRGTEEPQLKQLMKEIHRLCDQEEITVAAGHTAVSPAVRTLVLSVTGIGRKKPESDKRSSVLTDSRTPVLRDSQSPVSADGRSAALSGMDIIMVGHAGREGAALLAINREEELRSRYASFYIDTARDFYKDAGMKKAAEILFDCGAVKVNAVREGGVFGALWALAADCGVGLDIDLKAIPIRQHTIEICEFFDLNPYMLLSGGCLLAVCPDGEEALRKLEEEGSPDRDLAMAVIGKTTEGNDRLIRYDGETRYLEPSKMDEIYKQDFLV